MEPRRRGSICSRRSAVYPIILLCIWFLFFTVFDLPLFLPYLQYCFCEKPRGFLQSMLFLYFVDHLCVLFFIYRKRRYFRIRFIHIHISSTLCRRKSQKSAEHPPYKGTSLHYVGEKGV
jgi:hypothetical protein